MCAYSLTDLSDPKPQEIEYYPSFPTSISTHAQDEELSELEAGAFNKLPSEASSIQLNTKKPAIELALTTSKGGPAGFLSLLEALRLSGISIKHDTTVLAAEPSRNQGLTFPFWYIQLLSRGELFEANLSLADLAQGLSLVTNVPADKMAQALRDDLMSLASSTNKGAQFFLNFVDGLTIRNKEATSLLSGNSSELRFNSLQLGLLWLRLEAELKISLEESKITSSYESSGLSSNCDSTSKDLVNNSEIVKKNPAFSNTIKVTESFNSDSPANARRSLDKLVNFVKTHSGVMKAFTASYRAGLVGGNELVRTKTKTHGERKNYEIQFVPKLKETDELRCFSALAYSAGVQVSKEIGKDFLKGNKVNFSLEESLGQDRIAFELAPQVTNKKFSAVIGDNGFVRSPLIGLAQTKAISAKARAVQLKVPMKVEFNLSVLEYLTPVEGRDESNVVDAILAMEKLQERNKKKVFMVSIPVKDWMEAPEGYLSFTILGQDTQSSQSLSPDRFISITTTGSVSSKLTYNLGPQTAFNPGWPNGVPVPPGFPEELLNPSLVLVDDGIFDLTSELKHDIMANGECDPCRPEDGKYAYQAKYNDKAVSNRVKAAPGYTFVGPLSLDRKTMKLKTRIMLNVFKAKLNWRKTLDGDTCPGSGGSPGDSGSRMIDHMPKKGFELEVPFVEKDGVITVKSSYEIPLDYSLDSHQFPYKIPASLFIVLNMKIPLP